MKEDTIINFQPYFKIHEGKKEEFLAMLPTFVETTKSEEGMVYYGFALNDEHIFCREAYKNADAVLAHLGNVDALLKKALAISDLVKLEVSGPPAELERLKEPLAPFSPAFYELLSGGIRAD